MHVSWEMSHPWGVYPKPEGLPRPSSQAIEPPVYTVMFVGGRRLVVVNAQVDSRDQPPHAAPTLAALSASLCFLYQHRALGRHVLVSHLLPTLPPWPKCWLTVSGYQLGWVRSHCSCQFTLKSQGLPRANVCLLLTLCSHESPVVPSSHGCSGCKLADRGDTLNVVNGRAWRASWARRGQAAAATLAAATLAAAFPILVGVWAHKPLLHVKERGH